MNNSSKKSPSGRRSSSSQNLKSPNNNNNNNSKPKLCGLENYEIKQKIGQGAFGQVYLAVDKTIGKEVALKQMFKSQIKAMNKQMQVDNEKLILKQACRLNIKFLVHLHAAFRTDDALFLAMDFCPGGDLRELLDVIGVLTEIEAKLWFAEMCCAVHSLHKLNYIHRDLKPDNFFIDNRGHIKLGDFGLSASDRTLKKGPKYPTERESTRERLTIDNFFKRFKTISGSFQRRKAVISEPVITRHNIQAFSVVGTPEFMSPEVIAQRGDYSPTLHNNNGTTSTAGGSGYSFEVDWWSLGCVFYTCILGAPPFSGDTTEEIFKLIINWEQLLPKILGNYCDKMTKECYALLGGFLTEPSKRLGSDFTKIKSHRFFERLDWENLELEKSDYIPLPSASDK